MRQRVSNHIRSNVVAYVALFFALTSGAYALDGPLPGINQVGSEDIIAGEVKSADLDANSVGSAKVVDRSVKNADLSIGASSSNTIADGGIQGIDVKNDTLTGTQIDESSLSLTEPLASGETLTGIWGTNAPGSATTPGRGLAPIAFRPELAADLPNGSAHYLTAGSTTAECPGVGQAAAGHLCVYEGFSVGASFRDFANAGDAGAGSGVSKEGTILRLEGTDPLGQARGTWAVTAP
jgi:hypothetical protein